MVIFVGCIIAPWVQPTLDKTHHLLDKPQKSAYFLIGQRLRRVGHAEGKKEEKKESEM